MFDIPPVKKNNRLHQSELPVTLCQRVLEFVSKPGEIILDTFAGSGAVGEAALLIKRSCILIELLKENVEKIKNRLSNSLMIADV